MTLFAAEHAEMRVVRESDITGIIVDVDDITGMAAGAIPGDAEGLFAVVAEAAGLARGHIRHGEGRVLPGDDVIDIVVADGTILADRCHLHMRVVTELHLA